jgi:oligosaccharide translocation protein RFT1
MSSDNNGKAGSAAIRGASLLIVLQVASRAVTFIANQVLVRFLTAHLLGLSTQLEVYYLTVLFFARESLRVAVQRQPIGASGTKVSAKGADAKGDEKDEDARPGTAEESQAAVNLGYLAIPLGALVAAGTGWAFLRYREEGQATPYFTTSLKVYAVAAMVELLSEPSFVLMQLRLRFGTRAAAESIATFLRCIVTLAVALYASRTNHELGVLPFAVGQMTYGLALLLVYIWYGSKLASESGFSMLPKKLRQPNGAYVLSRFYKPTLSLGTSLMAQSIVKHFLTQGDTLLVSVLSTTKDQGVYALANNYGGLLARLIFQPIEESSRTYFSRLLSAEEEQGEAKGKTAEKTRRASRHLHSLLKTYILLSAVVVGLGPVAAPHLLALVAGRRWVGEGAGDVLATYCYYVPLLAINGVTEAFVASVASESQVHIQSIWMGVFSFVFGVAGFVFLRVMELGASGLVYANIVNMACRIGWCAGFITSYFGHRGVEFDLVSLQPHAATIGSVVAAPFLIQRILGLTASITSGSPFMALVMTGASALPLLFMLYDLTHPPSINLSPVGDG